MEIRKKEEKQDGSAGVSEGAKLGGGGARRAAHHNV